MPMPSHPGSSALDMPFRCVSMAQMMQHHLPPPCCQHLPDAAWDALEFLSQFLHKSWLHPIKPCMVHFFQGLIFIAFAFHTGVRGLQSRRVVFLADTEAKKTWSILAFSTSFVTWILVPSTLLAKFSCRWLCFAFPNPIPRHLHRVSAASQDIVPAAFHTDFFHGGARQEKDRQWGMS